MEQKCWLEQHTRQERSCYGCNYGRPRGPCVGKLEHLANVEARYAENAGTGELILELANALQAFPEEQRAALISVAATMARLVKEAAPCNCGGC